MKDSLKQKASKLRAELDLIDEKLRKKTIAEYYLTLKRKYEGRCFKYDNGYDSSEKFWLYTKVCKIEPEDVYDTRGNGVTSYYSGYSFETKIHNGIEQEVRVELSKRSYVHILGVEITQKEFDREWNKMLTKLKGLKK